MAEQNWKGVLVGTDGSASAQCAVNAAGAIGRALEIPVTVATAWYRPKVDDLTALEMANSPDAVGARNAHWATDTVVDAAATLREAGVEDVRTATPEGHPADALIKFSEDRPGMLVVVGTLGLDSTPQRVLGNIPHELTHHALADLLLVTSEECTTEISWPSIALATDGSATAALASARGAALAESLGAQTTLLTVTKNEATGQRVLGASGIETDETSVAVNRDTTRGLIEAAATHDMLVLGNKGMSGASRLLGSVANDVTHHLPTDLLLVNTTR